MARLQIRQSVEVYEIDDEDVGIGENFYIGVDSHWNRDEMVVLKLGSKSYTVLGRDLKTAIDNAMNSGGI